MKKLIFIISALCISCTNPEKATQTLNHAGYTNIVITGYDPFSCGEDDTFKDSFTATNPNGMTVSGTVCCGFLKGCTIRF